MKILSLFDGMGCGAIAFSKLKIPIGRYVAFEVDKYAIQTAIHNFPFIEERGDVFGADFTEFSDFDWLIGGSPCTYWSIVQKSNRETKASGVGWNLFNQYVRALREASPKYFLYENNKSMSKAVRQSITEAFGFEPICINSALVSAQNRQRLYWVGVRKNNGTYAKANIRQPADKGILLKDILQLKYGLENKAIEPINTTPQGKSQTIKSQYQQTSPRNICCYTSTYGASGVAELVRFELIKFSETGLIEAVSQMDGKTYNVYQVKDNNIIIHNEKYPIELEDGFYIIRKFTVDECMLLQTVPEWYEFPVSNYQSFRMLGNGWTVDVIAHILSNTIKERG